MALKFRRLCIRLDLRLPARSSKAKACVLHPAVGPRHLLFPIVVQVTAGSFRVVERVGALRTWLSSATLKAGTSSYLATAPSGPSAVEISQCENILDRGRSRRYRGLDKKIPVGHSIPVICAPSS